MALEVVFAAIDGARHLRRVLDDTHSIGHCSAVKRRGLWAAIAVILFVIGPKSARFWVPQSLSTQSHQMIQSTPRLELVEGRLPQSIVRQRCTHVRDAVLLTWPPAAGEMMNRSAGLHS